jgi:membrane protease YdiL (CAAX protease family)
MPSDRDTSYGSALERGPLDAQPYWGYEDIGAFFFLLVLLGPVLHLLARVHLLSRSAITHPGLSLQFAVLALLSVALYLVLKLRHHKPVLRPLGWVVPQIACLLAAIVVGAALATGVAFYLRIRNQSTPPISLLEFLLLGLIFGPTLEESFFRGVCLPVLAQNIGAPCAVVVTALVFALFHEPADWAHWVSFTITGTAYGWMRVASRSTTAAALTHAIYNLTLVLWTIRWR